MSAERESLIADGPSSSPAEQSAGSAAPGSGASSGDSPSPLLHLPDGLPDGWELVGRADGSAWELRRAGVTCKPGCACGDATLCGTLDPDLLSVCPKCHASVEDFDGFGVLIHDACGYCSHPDSYDGKCRHCEAPDA